MDWICLGHAGWLIEAAGLRLLCDPLLRADHYRGVFEVCPPRQLRAEQLRPDFILISHQHPDHFDVPSLARLAELDRESVVVTPDALVAEAAQTLGFTTVHQVAAGQRIELDGLTLVTTESLALDEWGVMVATADGVVWNQVDTVFDGPAHARAVLATGLAALGRERVDLALVQGRPMHEIAAQLGASIGFPYDEYAKLLAELAAISPAVIVPASTDTAHAEPFKWLNHVVYPVDEPRFVRDAARACPAARVLASRLGARYRVRAGEVSVAEDMSLIDVSGPTPDRSYRPFAITPMHDHGERLEPDPRKPELRAWIESTLRDALVAAYPEFGVRDPLRFVVEAVFPGQTPGQGEALTLVIDRAGGRVEPGADPDWDLYNLVIGTMAAEVIAGRRAWGDLLLAGGLRAATRAYSVSERGLERANVGETFLYYGLSYEESTRSAVRWERGGDGG